MKRRKFIQKGALAGSFLGLGGLGIHHAYAKSSPEEQMDTMPFSEKKHKFNLKYAPHIGMFKELAGENPIAQLDFMASQGFTALSLIHI